MFLVQFKGSLADLQPVVTEKEVNISLIKEIVEKETDIYGLKLDEYCGDTELWSELFSGLISEGRHFSVKSIKII